MNSSLAAKAKSMNAVSIIDKDGNSTASEASAASREIGELCAVTGVI